MSNGDQAAPPPDPYAGDWTTATPPIALSIRPLEKQDWQLVMYFPGDPDCAIPRGYYPLCRTPEGTYRSSSAFPDSAVELRYGPKLDTLVRRPLFHSAKFAQELYDPVRIWRDQGSTDESTQ